jgi:hypothetical protein
MPITVVQHFEEVKICSTGQAGGHALGSGGRARPALLAHRIE